MSLNEILNYDNTDHPYLFFLKVYSGVIGGLFIGSLIDSLCRKLQNDRKYHWRELDIKKSILFFILQITINIIILFILSSLFPLRFLEWLQMTISGSLFSTLLFITQQNLVNNTLRIFYIS